MNGALQDFLNDIQELCQEMAPEPSVAAMLAPSHLREKCKQEAADMVARNNMVNDKAPGKMTQLVTDLTALMLQVKVKYIDVLSKFILYFYLILKIFFLIFLYNTEFIRFRSKRI